MTPIELLAGHALAIAVYERSRSVIADSGPIEIRTSKSQIAFRRKRAFAYIWRPGQYLSNPAAEVVLSIALGRRIDSPRFKEVVHPSARHWMHHLEVVAVDEIDDEVAAWLSEAYARAG